MPSGGRPDQVRGLALTEDGGTRGIYGCNGVVVDSLADEARVLRSIDRSTDDRLNGPTAGDQARLAATNLVAEVEDDHVLSGNEPR